MSDHQPPSPNKPVYHGGEDVNPTLVFLDTRTVRTGERAGESYDVFNYVKGDERITVPVRVGGYNLENGMTRDEKYSDVVRLVEGDELVVWARSRAGNDYPLILAPIGIKETQSEKDPAKVFKTLQVVAALAEFAQDAGPNTPPRAFIIPSIDDQGVESETRDLKCYRSVGGKDAAGKKHYVPLRVSDALRARDALAKGQPFSFEHEGFTVSLDGVEQVLKSKTPMRLLRFKAEPSAQANAAPLPEESASATKARSA